MSFELLNLKWGVDDLGTPSGPITWTMNLAGLRFDTFLYPDITRAAYETAIRDAFDAWEAVAQIDFVEVPNPFGVLGDFDVDIDLSFAPLPGITVGEAVTTFQPGTDDGDNIDTILDVSIEFNVFDSWSPNAALGGLSLYAVAVHELGHALGLDHVDDETEILNPFVSTDELGDGDIAGVQLIYGARQDPFTPDQSISVTRFGGNEGDILTGADARDSLYGLAGNDHLDGAGGGDALFGGAGIDRALYTNANAGVVADMILTDRNTGEAAGDRYSSIELLFGSDHSDELRGTQTNNVVAGMDGHDQLYGRGGNDDLFGGAGNDQLDGGTGADELYGGSGIDRVVYNTASSGVVADLILSNRNTGDAAGDTYSSIELVYGSGFNDELRGTQTNNVLVGNGGTDRLYGRSGNDDIYGGDGNDQLDGGLGADDLFGGAGIDRAVYFSASAGVVADLILNERNTGDAAGDTYSSIELLYGSAFDDELRGTQTNNVLAGNNGDDLLIARGGNDDVFGGAGDDVLYGDAGNDDLFGGSGADRFVFRGAVDADIVHDFANNVDTLLFDDALWTGTRSVQQVIDTFGSISGGSAVFDFGGGDTVTIAGVSNLSVLSDDIIIF